MVLADRSKAKFYAAIARPASDSRGITVHKRKIGDIFRDDRACTDKTVAAKGVAADDRRVGSNTRSSTNPCHRVCVSTRVVTSGRSDVCKDHRWPAKNIVFEDNASVNRDVILDFYVVADLYTSLDHYVLTKAASLAYFEWPKAY